MKVAVLRTVKEKIGQDKISLGCMNGAWYGGQRKLISIQIFDGVDSCRSEISHKIWGESSITSNHSGSEKNNNKKNSYPMVSI